MSGPVCITDKSALESLSVDEVSYLYRYFFINIPPILIIEIMKDLKPKPKRKGDPLSRVIALARKSGRLESMINVDHRTICLNELLGRTVELRGVCNISNPVTVIETEDGTRGEFIEDSEGEAALLRWKLGLFTDTEKSIASKWREGENLLDQNWYRESLERLYIRLPAVRSLAAVPAAVETLINRLNLQEDLLVWLINVFDVRDDFAIKIYERFKGSSNWYIKDYSPYAYYCLRVFFTFFIGHTNKLFRKNDDVSNILDLQYCFYLPFTKVFTSKDAFHKDIVPLLLEPYNDFVTAEDLKADLDRLRRQWSALDEQGRRELKFKYREHPPTNDGSVISRIWQRFVGPVTPWPPGVRLLTPEERAAPKQGNSEFEEFLRGITDPLEEAYRKATGNKNIPRRLAVGKVDKPAPSEGETQ